MMQLLEDPPEVPTPGAANGTLSLFSRTADRGAKDKSGTDPTSLFDTRRHFIEYYAKIGFCVFLVLIGGVFSGLTLGLMGQ